MNPLSNYDRLERYRLNVEQIRIIKKSIQSAWGKLHVAASILNASPDFMRVSFCPIRNIHFQANRQWLSDVINRYPEVRASQIDAEESALDLIEFHAINLAIGKQTDPRLRPNLQAIQFYLTTKGKKRGYGLTTTEMDDLQKVIDAKVVELLKDADTDTIREIAGIPKFESVTKSLKEPEPQSDSNTQQAHEKTETTNP